VTILARIFTKPASARTLLALCQKAMPILEVLSREDCISTSDLVVSSQRTNGAPSRVKSAMNLTLPNVPRCSRDWRRADSFQDVQEKSFIEGRVEYIQNALARDAARKEAAQEEPADPQAT
jgi:hypothetical protein